MQTSPLSCLQQHSLADAAARRFDHHRTQGVFLEHDAVALCGQFPARFASRFEVLAGRETYSPVVQLILLAGVGLDVCLQTELDALMNLREGPQKKVSHC